MAKLLDETTETALTQSTGLSTRRCVSEEVDVGRSVDPLGSSGILAPEAHVHGPYPRTRHVANFRNSHVMI